MKMIIEKRESGLYSLPTKEIGAKGSRIALSPIAIRILESLTEKSDYPKNLAKRMRLHEQKVYYYIHSLEGAGMIKVVKEENINGVIAKYYGVEKPSFSIMLKDMEPAENLSMGFLSSIQEFFLEPFIHNSQLNATIILGSPEPHGPNKARAKDGVYAINLGLFLGKFLNTVPENMIKLDTEVKKEDMKGNLIIIGGPGVNQISAHVNDRLPVRFKQNSDGQYFSIYSTLTKKTYTEEECGLIVKTKNPFDTNGHLLLIAGRRAAGTKAAIIAFMHNLNEISRGNRKSQKTFAKVFEGLDKDSDGIIDSVEERE